MVGLKQWLRARQKHTPTLQQGKDLSSFEGSFLSDEMF